MLGGRVGMCARRGGGGVGWRGRYESGVSGGIGRNGRVVVVKVQTGRGLMG